MGLTVLAIAALKVHPSLNNTLAEWTGEEKLLRELLIGHRRIWVEVHQGGQMIAFPVDTLEAFQAAANEYPLPSATAVIAGLTLEDALHAGTPHAVSWLGDFNQQGAACGLLLGALLPHDPDAPVGSIEMGRYDRDLFAPGQGHSCPMVFRKAGALAMSSGTESRRTL